MLRFKIANPEEYTDNKIGRIFNAMLVESYHDAIVKFKNHVVQVTHNKEDRKYHFKMNEMKKEHPDYFIVKGDAIEEVCDCQKYVGYMLMFHCFRKVYDIEEIQVDECFPVGEMEIIFTQDVECTVFHEDEIDENDEGWK